MDGNKDDQKGKQGEHPLVEHQERGKTKDYPVILRPKFAKKKRIIRKTKGASRETLEEVCPSAEKIEDEETVEEEVKKEKKKMSKKSPIKEEEEGEWRGGEETESLDEGPCLSREKVDEETKVKSVAPKKKNLSREVLSKETVEDEKPTKGKGLSREKVEDEPKKKITNLSKERVDDEAKKKGTHLSKERVDDEPKKKTGNLSKELIEPETKKPDEAKNRCKETEKPKQRTRRGARIVQSKKVVRKSGKEIMGSRNPSPVASSVKANRRTKTMTASQKLKKKRKKKIGFREFFIQKVLRRKSDCVAQPTKDMLVKPVVQAEYDVNNPIEFSPDPRPLFTEEEWKARLKNARNKKEDIFVNSRPFWLIRTHEDIIPKCRMIEASEYLSQKSASAPTLLKPQTRRQKFYDPKHDSVEKMISADHWIGVDRDDPWREKELARLRANTIHAVVAIQSHRKANEGKKKDDVKVESNEDKVSSASNSGKKIVFLTSKQPDQLHEYSRKDRPALTGKQRTFTRVDYTDGHKGIRRKQSMATVKCFQPI